MVTGKILIFGGERLTGQNLKKEAASNGWDVFAPTKAECDLSSAKDISSAFHNFSPDFVINAADVNDLSICEEDPRLAKEVNFHAVAHIAGQCDTLNAPLLHLSSDLVFDGNAPDQPYSEDDGMNPLCEYGKTKLLGEEAVRHGMYWHVILRTSAPFGTTGNNLFTSAIKNLDTTSSQQSNTGDFLFSPISSLSLTKAILIITKAIMGGKVDGFGTFHLGGTQTSKNEFISETAKACGKMPSLNETDPDKTQIRNLTLDCSKIMARYGIAPPDWKTDLLRTANELPKTDVSIPVKCCDS